MKASDIRELIPPLGLKEYWYPALPAREVRGKPVGLRIMGEDLVFFRGRDGDVAALNDVCPHRGGSFAHGDCHYKGTVACPYHGWVFDEDGECLAVLSEGPDSRIPGKVRARKYPTQTHKGLVFVWMGDETAVDIAEDVPPEFFEGEETMLFTAVRDWPVNWRVALENSLDSHVMYVHRNALLQLKEAVAQFGRFGYYPRIVNDKTCIGYIGDPPTFGQHYYPKLGAFWPKTDWRRYWLWMFRFSAKVWTDFPPYNGDEEWDMHTEVNGQRVRSGGHHLPTMFRFDFGTHMYTRACVPIDEETTRVIYYHSVRRPTALGRLKHKLYFYLFLTWAMHDNFSEQDHRVMAPQRYDTPEKLSGTDAQVIAWRKLLLKARGMPDNVVVPEVETLEPQVATGD
ncbi:MAG: Rieske 2Fe-2S domain-containing protein [Alphaproteobacteria bacterium]